MIFMEMLIFVALSSGSLLSSYVYAATNAAVTQGISAFLITMVTMYIACYLPESLHIRLAQDAKDAEEKDEKDLSITVSDTQLKCTSIDCSNKTEYDVKSEKVTSELGKIEAQLNEKQKSKQMNSEESKEKTDCEQREMETDLKTAGLFSLTHLKEMLVTCCKPREHNARGIIWLVTWTMFMSMFVVGEYCEFIMR